MYRLNLTENCDKITFFNCTNIETKDKIIILKNLLYSIPRSILLFSLIGSMIYTMI